MSDAMRAVIDQLRVYPVKGCRGFTVERATLAATGLEVGSIQDVTPQPHNGTRPAKRRRV